MELITLDDDFQPLNAVENYQSLIWSERYDKNGDFELISADIAGMTSLMPRESYVSLRDSSVPMVVENHKLVKPIRDIPQVSITGRSFETVIERRGSVNQLSASIVASIWNIDATKESDAAYLAMRTVMGDIARGSVLTSTAPAVSPNDAIPELDLTLPADYYDLVSVPGWVNTTGYVVGNRVRYSGYVWTAIANSGPAYTVTPIEPSSFGDGPTYWTRGSEWRQYEIKRQNLYTTVMELLVANRHGLKAVRPLPGSNQVGIEIYNGGNLTGEGDTGDPNFVVVIDARFDQIDEATYLLSEQGSTNIGYVYGSNGAQVVYKNTIPGPDVLLETETSVGVEHSGLDRRVLIVDDTGDDTASTTDVRKTRGLIELYKYNATALFDGQVAEQVAAGYNRDYFLGDILKLVGEYGLEEKVRVSEFIRSEDAQGEKAYPTFEAVDD